MILRMTLERPVPGYWDGGAKDTFDFAIDSLPKRDALGPFIRVGSLAANHWFHVPLGKTPRATLGHARRRLAAQAKRAGMPCRFSYHNDGANPFERRAFEGGA
jgi:hypothetical protein